MKCITKPLGLAICMFLLMTGIPEAGLPGDLRQIMDENRETTFPSLHPDLEDTINSFVQLNLDRDEHVRIFEILRRTRTLLHTDGMDTSVLWRIFGTADLGALLTHEQLNEEIRFLFDLLRHGYDGYLYFGGDDVFLPIRDAMLERLANMADPLPVFSYLYGLLVPAFQGVVADNHFRIHNVRFWAPTHIPYMNGEFILRKGEGNFVTVINGVPHRVVEVTGLPSPSVDGILPTLTPDGEFAWAFGFVTPNSQPDAMEIMVLFENTATGENHSQAINLQRVNSWQLPTHPVVVKHEVKGIPVLENRSLLNLSPEEEIAFLRSSYELRDRPVLVMDLRGHIGGNSGLPRQWVGTYTGQEPQIYSLFAASRLLGSRVATELLHFFVPLHISALIDGVMETLMAIDPRFATIEDMADPMLEQMPLITSVPMTPPRVPISNENLVIVLTDKTPLLLGNCLSVICANLKTCWL